ncbi:hypothetical protein [Methylorubrum thiocyanatum]|uniref:hypothetical protein n=1 Tax=Methylorubrum thiocyanatum TaxID=47958 RepID=UPI00398C28DC
MKLIVTQGGRAVARSGLLPVSADELIGYVSRNAEPLVDLLRKCADGTAVNCDDFAFVMSHAAYSCSEYGGRDLGAKRYLPYQLLESPLRGPYAHLRGYMFVPSEDDAINAATLATRWVAGENIRNIENSFGIRSGALTSMFSEAANILRGLSDVLFAVTSPQDPDYLPTSVDLNATSWISEVIGSIRRLAFRLDVGLPEDVLWMSTLMSDGSPLLSRAQIMTLRSNDFLSPDNILDTGKFPALMAALGRPSTQTTALAQQVQASVRSWRVDERTRLAASQIKRLPADCKHVVQKFYRSREKEFEDSLEEIFSCIGITIDSKDDGSKSSYPDFVTTALPHRVVSIECKSKTVGDSVTFSDATDVIRKASVNGLEDSFKVTVCQPYISPDVVRKLVNCRELCVVNAEDLAEAFVRLKLGKITIESFSDWLQRPGQALRDMIPTSSFSVADQNASVE